MNTDADKRRAWCYFRNLVHTTYREARHIGLGDDPMARLRVPGSHQFSESARRCSGNRELLKGKSLFKGTATAKSVDEVVQPYRDVTGLDLKDLVSLFAEENWALQYGGKRWAKIAEVAVGLGEALRSADLDHALRVCAVVASIQHNSGKLVPSLENWQSTPYLREKWPDLCDGDRPNE